MKHYHAMNGSSGCLPDSNVVFTSKRAAIDYLAWMFDNVPTRGMKTDLLCTGSYYFANPAEAGAEYCEVVRCDDDACMEGWNE